MRARRVVAGTLLAVALWSAGACDRTADRGEDPPVSNNATSRLDPEGVQQIEEQGRAVLDLRDGAVTRGEVGLGERELGPVVGRPGSSPVTLVLRTPGGTEEVRTESFSVAFNRPGGPASYVTWFVRHDSDQEALAALEQAVERWGVPASDVRHWRERLAQGRVTSSGGRASMVLGPGRGPSELRAEVEARALSRGQVLQYLLYLEDR